MMLHDDDTAQALGYLASSLVLATFCMRDMRALRLMAIASNLAFIAYAALAGIQPVLWLHVVLLPMNLWRLLELYGGREPPAPTLPREPFREPQR